MVLWLKTKAFITILLFILLGAGYLTPLCRATVKDHSLDNLIAAYKNAHKTKRIEAVLELYYWEGIDERIKNSVVKNHTRYLDYKIVSIKAAKAPLKEYNPFILDGKRYKTTLEVTKVLKIKFENTTEVTVPIGIKDGKYYFVTARPDP